MSQIIHTFGSFYLYGFLLGLGRHLVLAAVVVQLAAILFQDFARGFGIPRLFWHEDLAKQALAGFASGLLIAEALFVGYLLDTQLNSWRGRWTSAAIPLGPDPVALLGYYLAAGATAWVVTLVGLRYVVLGVATGALRLVERGWHKQAVRPSRRQSNKTRPPLFGTPFMFGLIVAALVVWALLHVTAALEPAFKRLAEVAFVEHRLPLFTVPLVDPWLHLVATIYFLIFLVFYVVGFASSKLITPAAALCVFLALVCASYGALTFQHYHPALLLAGAALLVIVGGAPSYKVRFDSLSARYATPAIIQQYAPAAPEPPFPPAPPRRVLAVACLSGGGIRAAVWSMQMLTLLERSLPDFTRCLRLVCGASGGMLGAGAYASTVEQTPPDPNDPNWFHKPTREELIARVSRESLSPTVKQMIFHDLPLAFLPVPNLRDRGNVIEEQWRTDMPWLTMNFAALEPGEASGWRPPLVYSPMLVEDGRRLLISNLNLDFLSQSRGPVVGMPGSQFYSASAFEFHRLFGAQQLASLPVSTAARMAATFPFVTPAAVLPTDPRRRAVDAGYYDNFGVGLACDWLFSFVFDPQRKDWLMRHIDRVVLIEIRDGPTGYNKELTEVNEDASSPATRGLEFVLDPIQGALAARSSVPVFRNDQKLSVLADAFANEFAGRIDFTVSTFEFSREASLSWYLSREEQRALAECAGGKEIGDEVARLQEWWSAAG